LAAEVIPCRAKLGEKLDSCASSYGIRIFPVDHSDPDGKNLFQKKKFVYEISTAKGIVFAEVIYKSDKSTFTDKEKEALLQNEGGSWKKDLRITNKSAEAWSRDNGASAIFFSADDSKSWVSGVLEWPSIAFQTH
jgi:hypothetical protein